VTGADNTLTNTRNTARSSAARWFCTNEADIRGDGWRLLLVLNDYEKSE